MPAKYRESQQSITSGEPYLILSVLYKLPNQRATADRIVFVIMDEKKIMIDRIACTIMLRDLEGAGLVSKHNGIYELTGHGRNFVFRNSSMRVEQ